MAEDMIIALYEQGGDLASAGKLEEAAEVYQKAYDICKQSEDAEQQSRLKIFASKLGPLYYKLGQKAKALPYYQESGQMVPQGPCNLLDVKSSLAVMKKLGMLAELTPKLQKKIMKELFGGDSTMEGSSLPDFLTAYYRYDVEDSPADKPTRITPLTSRAARDGVTWYDVKFSNDTDDPFADFCEIIGGAPICVSKELQFRPKPFKVVIEEDSGAVLDLPVDGIHDIVKYFNEALAARGDDRRFYSVSTGGDYSFWMLCDPGRYQVFFKGSKPLFLLE